MQHITDDQLKEVVRILGEIPEARQESAANAFLGSDLLARRAIDWLVEAFGLVRINHIATLNLPQTFKVRGKDGAWQEVPFSADPIFSQALRLGTELYHQGQRELFGKIALRSAMVDVVNKALNAGEDISGATLGPPAMLGLQAESYAQI